METPTNMKKRMKSNRSKLPAKTLIVVWVSWFSFVLPISAQEQDGMPPAQVSLVTAQTRMIAPTKSITGSVISTNDSRLSNQVGGELTWLAEVGSLVKKGDLVARIEPTILSANLQTAKAQLERLKVDLDYRAKEVKRFKTLATRDNASKARLQEESAKHDMLIQDIKVANANLITAQYFMSQAEIRAPFSGHITHRMASLGEYLAVGTPLIRLVDTFKREIVINAPLNLLTFFDANSIVDVTALNQSARLPLSAIVPVGDQASRMVEVRLSVAETKWLIGTPVTVNLPSAPALNRVSFPRDALVIKGSDLFVYRVDSSMKAEQIKVEIDAIDGKWVAIKAALNDGDKIVVRGGERLMPGQSVNVLEQ
jgi:RND family efflux transporter MFP subunit